MVLHTATTSQRLNVSGVSRGGGWWSCSPRPRLNVLSGPNRAALGIKLGSTRNQTGHACCGSGARDRPVIRRQAPRAAAGGPAKSRGVPDC